MNKIHYNGIDGVSFSYDFYLKHISYTNIYELNQDIYDLQEQIKSTQQLIFGLTVATPILNAHDTIGDMVMNMQITLQDHFNYLEETQIKLFKLELLRELMS